MAVSISQLNQVSCLKKGKKKRTGKIWLQILSGILRTMGPILAEIEDMDLMIKRVGFDIQDGAYLMRTLLGVRTQSTEGSICCRPVDVGDSTRFSWQRSNEIHNSVDFRSAQAQ